MLINYLKIAYKVLLRRKFFTFVSLFGISFTLVVLMVVASMLDHVLAPAAPEVNLGRSLHVSYMSMSGENRESSGSPGFGFLDQYCRDLPGVEQMSVFSEAYSVVSFLGGQKIVSEMRHTDAEYWHALDFTFVAGNPFNQADYDAGRRVAVINQQTQTRFFAEEEAVGKSIDVDGQTFVVIGVVKNVPPVRFAAAGDVYVPISTAKSDVYLKRLMGSFNALLVAESRSRFPDIRAEFASRLEHVEFPDNKHYDTMRGEPKTRLDEVAMETAGPNDDASSKTQEFVVMLAGGGLLFMLLPAINLVNINISRIYERTSEIGVRKAFGASTAHLVGQFVVENVFLSLVGGVIGLLGAAWVLQMINSSGWIPHADFHLNLRIFGYGFVLATLFGLLSGVYPAWKMSRLDVVDALRGGSR